MATKKVDISTDCGKTRRMTIKQHRAQIDMSIADLARRLGVHRRTIERWENVPHVPKRRLRKCIAEVFGVDASDIDWHVPDAVAG